MEEGIMILASLEEKSQPKTPTPKEMPTHLIDCNNDKQCKYQEDVHRRRQTFSKRKRTLCNKVLAICKATNAHGLLFLVTPDAHKIHYCFTDGTRQVVKDKKNYALIKRLLHDAISTYEEKTNFNPPTQEQNKEQGE